MAGVGRPCEYDPGFCDLLVEYMRDGYSFRAAMAKLGYSHQAGYEWVKKFPEFGDAKKRGEDLSYLYWEEVGKEGLHNQTIKDGDGMTITKSINATVWIFMMKNRFGWRDKQPDEEPKNPGEADQGKVKLTPEELVSLVQKARKAKK